MSRILPAYVEAASACVAAHEPFVTVTLVQIEGHVPQDLGAKAIVTREGLRWGTVGGGRLEARAIDHAKSIIEAAAAPDADRKPQLIRYDLKQELGMVCGGVATLFYELAIEPRWTIAVFGAGHVAQATVPLLSKLHCQVLCYDPREDWLEKIPVAPNLRKIHATDLPAAVASVPANAFYVVITQGHVTDLPVVRAILKRGSPKYLGVIGSVPKSRTLKGALLEEGVSKDLVGTITCPIGLPFGTNDPQEIAISIAGQLLQVRSEAGLQS